MGAYILRRLLQSVVVLFALTFLCYYLLSLMPGDPVEILASSNPKITAEDIDRLKALYGVDRPVTERFMNWFKSAITGDLGFSRTYKVPVADLIGPRLLNTFLLSMASFLLALIIGTTIGVIAGLKPGGVFDYIANFFAFIGISTPSFWLGIVLIIVFSVQLNWFPAGGTYTVGSDMGFFETIVDRIKYLILPAVSLTALSTGSFVRYARSSMAEVMRNDYIRTAKAKGMSRSTVIWVHGFRNALIPVVTVAALSMSTLFSGAILTETIFGYQGVGSLILKAIIESDFNVAMVSFVITIAMVLFMNLIADILYTFADPRISYN